MKRGSRKQKFFGLLNQYETLRKFLFFSFLVRFGDEFKIIKEGNQIYFSVPKGGDVWSSVVKFLHLVGHVLLRHDERKSSVPPDDKVWDIACDFSVSNFLFNEIVSNLPQSVRSKMMRYLKPFDPLFLNLSTEEIYLKLKLKGKSENIPRAGDDHSSLTDPKVRSQIAGVTQKYKDETMKNQLRDGKSSSPGFYAGNARVEIELKEIKLPPRLIQTLLSRYSKSLKEDFDVVDIPSLGMGRIIHQTPLTPYPHVVFLLDCSDSMLASRYIQLGASFIWTCSLFLTNHFPHGKITIITADVRKTGLWSGWHEIHKLKSFLSNLYGFGGTDIISPFMEILPTLKPFPYAVFIISDYEFYATTRFPVVSVIETFRKFPLYIAVVPSKSNPPVVKGITPSNPTVWDYHSWKRFRDELPDCQVAFNELLRQN